MLLLSFIYLSVLYSTNDSLVFKPWICFFYRQDLVPHLLLFFPPSPPRGQICLLFSLFPPPVKQLSTQLLLYIYIRKKVKSLSLVRFFVTPWTAAYQAPPSMGFSRQAYWSGLPFPSPVHESEKWNWSHSVVSDSLWPHELQPTRLLRPWDFPGKSTGVGCHCLLHFASFTWI